MKLNSLSLTNIKSKRLKIVILGEGGIGKTTMAKTYQQGTPFLDSHQTIAVEFHTKREQTDEGAIILQIWDFGGQEQFREMGIFDTYCQGSHGALLCFDLTDIQTFLSLPRWLAFVNNKLPKILVGTKADLYNLDPYLEEDIATFCEKNGIQFFIKTSVHDVTSVNKAFMALIEKILEKENDSIRNYSKIALMQKTLDTISSV